jgi:hypothetical protein
MRSGHAGPVTMGQITCGPPCWARSQNETTSSQVFVRWRVGRRVGLPIVLPSLVQRGRRRHRAKGDVFAFAPTHVNPCPSSWQAHRRWSNGCKESRWRDRGARIRGVRPSDGDHRRSYPIPPRWTHVRWPEYFIAQSLSTAGTLAWSQVLSTRSTQITASNDQRRRATGDEQGVGSSSVHPLLYHGNRHSVDWQNILEHDLLSISNDNSLNFLQQHCRAIN